MTSQPRRRRSVTLTSQGLQKLQAAISHAESHENKQKRYTLEDLSNRTGLDTNTLRKVFACEIAVDKRTLSRCFRAFNLLLEADDYEPSALRSHFPSSQISSNLENFKFFPKPEIDLEMPDGPVELGSKFYIERFPVEVNCYQAILKPGVLIRINAPRQMGKTSLMTRIVYQAKLQGYHTVALNIQLADSPALQDVDRFLRWLCVNVGRGLQLPNKLADYWDEIFGSKMSCKDYFESYLLAQLNQPLVLALDNMDYLFKDPDFADNIFALLRACHEEAKNNDVWKKLRLILIYSTDVYIPLNIHQSPFNIGLTIELPEFLPEQICELAYLYGLMWESIQVEKLMAMIGGHPYLVRIALFYLSRRQMSLEQLIKLAPTEAGPYQAYLRRYLFDLKQQPELLTALKTVVDTTYPIRLDSMMIFKLYSMGLIHLKENKVMLRCELYREYFRDRLLSHSDKNAKEGM